MRSGTPRGKSNQTRKTGRPGQHKRPSQVRRAAQRAGLAVPALAVAGALAAAPQALAAPVTSQPGSPAVSVPRVTALWQIAQRFYGQARAWHWLYQVNSSTVSDPNLIKIVQALSLPAASLTPARASTYRPRHARTSAHASGAAAGSGGTVTCSADQGMVPANYATIVSFLAAHGYTGIAAAGVAGNIYQESKGDPESIGSGGGGLIGWTPLPSGFVTGDPAADLHTQLNALLTYNQQWSQFLPALNAATSATQAADIYMNDFERPGLPAAGNREAAAGAVAAACGF